jgi:hypothetical protein
MIFQELCQISRFLQPAQKLCALPGKPPGKLNPKHEAFYSMIKF